MSDYSDSSHTEMQSNHKIQTELKLPNDLRKSSYELDLLSDLQEAQTKTEEGTNKKEPIDLESLIDLQKLLDAVYIQNDNAVETNKDNLASDDELTCDNEIFGDLLTKIRAFAEKSKETDLEKNILTDEWQIFNDFFNLMEKHEQNLTDEDLSIVKRGLEWFVSTADNVHSFGVLTTDLIHGKEIFYMYFNLINLPVIQNYLKRVDMFDDLKILYCNCISRILYVMSAAIKYTGLSLNDLQRPTNCIELLSLMLNYVKTELETSDLTINPSISDEAFLRCGILGVFWSYADKTIVVPDLIEAGCLKVIIDGLAMICKTAEVDSWLQTQLISIIYNISRHDDGRKQLNALNASRITIEFQNYNKDNLLNIICCMTLGLLATPEQIKNKNDRKRMNKVLDTLLEMMYDASVSSDYCYHTAIGSYFHSSELLIVFVKLFNDDRILDYIMEHSQVNLHTSTHVNFFINLLIDYYSTVDNEDHWKQATCTALVNILWSVSFQERYKQKLKNSNTKFKELIQNLAKETDEKIAPNQYVPQYIENIRKAATGLLVNIDELFHPITEQAANTSSGIDNNQKPMIMISYSHEDTEFCQQLYNEILKKGYDIWIDFKFLKTGDLWEQIAAGMKRANAIICLISEDYCKSKSCRMEATYALEKLQATKSVIPVILRKHELPDWLEIRIAMLKYVLFRDLKQLENEKLLELMNSIEYSVPAIVPRTDFSLHPPVLPSYHESTSVPMTKDNEFTLHSSNVLPVYHNEPKQSKPTVTKSEKQDVSSKSGLISCATTDQSPYPEKPIKQWNKNDISQWFQHNKIRTELHDLCDFEDGYELLAYAKIFLDTKKLQYLMYSEEFSKPDGITFGKRPLLLHEFTKFSNALRKLKKFKKSSIAIDV